MASEPEYLLDTNICIYLLDEPSTVLRDRLARCDRGSLVTSALVYAEVMIGAVARHAADRALALFAQVPPQLFDRASADAYSMLQFKRGNLDRMIAAHTLSLGLTLVTSNEGDFSGIVDLRVENWT